jgi:CPA1 family monovalent cation:H+ antiporter
MQGLELVVVIGVTLLLGGAIASRIRVAAPLVFLVLGGALGFIPLLGEVELPPELVLLLFLPALLYWDSLNTSLREIWANLRVILLLAIGLVFATTAVVAVVGHAFGLSWPVAIVLGAVLAPTDATAVAAVAGRLPRRSLTILRAESLVNDGTALVIYAVAVAAAVSGDSISIGAASLQFLASYGLGIVIGVAVGLIVVGIRYLVRERLSANTLSVLTPFLAYLPAELLGVSGVVAVVTCGLLLSQLGPRLITASMRAQSFGFWQLATYILNGSLFVLIGFQLHTITMGLNSNWFDTIVLGLIAALVVLGARFGWVNTTPYLIRLLDRRPQQRERRVSFRQRFPLAWAGFRGAVSLAAALAIPTETSSGDPLPGRGTVIAVTFVVILFTLLVQGLSMPAIVRWAQLEADPAERDEELLAEQVTLQAVLDALPETADRIDSPDDARETLEGVYREMLDRIHRDEDDPAQARRDESASDHEARLRLALVPVKRAALLKLRSENRIDDDVQRKVQARIDLEELRLSDSIEDE